MSKEYEQLKEVIKELKKYRIAFELLLKDDCLNDKYWLGSLDELYKGRKEYYLDKARKIIESRRKR